MSAKGQNTAQVDWSNIMAVPVKPNYGYLHTNYDPIQEQFTLVPSTGGAQTPEESGEEWWYAHCNVKDAVGNVIGYAAAGYAAGLSWRPYDGTGCHDWSTTIGPADEGELESANLRKGLILRSFIALFNLDGTMSWCRTILPGTFYGITQAADGDLVAVGDLFLPRRAEQPDLNDDPLPYNPGLGNGDDIADVSCDVPLGIGLPPLGPMKTKAYAAKINLSGDLVWQNAYGSAIDYVEGWGQGGRCYGIAPITIQGEAGFYVTMDAVQLWGMRIREADGHVIDRGPLGQLDGANIRAVNVASVQLGGSTHLAFSGTHYTGGVPGASVYNAFAAHIADMDAAPFTFTESWRTLQPAFGPWHTQGLLQNSTDIAFAQHQGQLSIIWPVLTDFTPGTDIIQGRSIAQLRVHRLEPGNSTPVWTTDLGEVRAYDLQAGAVQLTDGHIAIVSSKWPMGRDVSNPIGFGDLEGDVQQCLLTQFNGWNGDWETTDQYDFWKTDAYLAKLRMEDGANIWHGLFDAEPEVPPTCYPADTRDQECMYRISEAPDRGLVVSGNTSHNFDDAYLAKASMPCQALQDLDFLSLDPSGEHILAANTTWNSDMAMYGTIVIPSGITLTITNCTIRFADSEQLAWPTRIIIEGGGSLILNGATLTSITDCPNSLWDGVQLRGQELASQQPYPGIGLLQGYLSMKNSTISNARTGVAVTDGDFLAPLPPKPGSGGILEATDCIFLNNKFDVAFSPYENTSVANPETILPNFSRFVRCQFKTDGGLPTEGVFPVDHITMTEVRGILFSGCTWSNSLLGQTLELPSQQSVGIHAINSSFVVADNCSVLVQQGEPCPAGNLTTSSFTNLHRGILATTFDPSRTFSVDNATFTGTNFGIRMEGIQDASITRCDFNVPTPFTPGIVGSTYGVYSDQCTGYRIQENLFRTTQPGAPRKVGLVIKDSGPYYNTFYNNTFENLYTGSIIEGDNADANEELGLEVKCNDYGLTDQNIFDVALTGTEARVQKTQGQPINFPNDPQEITNPAGNRFSVDHTGVGDPEEDWHVQVAATVVEYFHHSPTAGNRTYPDYSDFNFLFGNSQNAAWPGEAVACPSQLNNDGKEVKRLMAEGEHGEYEDNKEAYDATKDNGDTYSLLGYVSDPTKSSTQVRNALQSVAPKVSAEVWKAAFERSPAMSAWNMTQALLSNSPLQSEVLRMVDEYALPSGYASLVHGVQTGEVHILTLLVSAIAHHGGSKAEALADLGRLTWLDSLDLGGALDSLRLFHEALPADNHALAVGGVLAAQADYSALATLAQAEESASTHPERYTLLKQYAQLEQQQGWAEPDEALRTWLGDLGQQRDVLGSAWANAWLHALGEELPEEVIILPEEGPKSGGRSRAVQPVQWAEEQVLEVFPNPAKQVAFVVFEQAAESKGGELRILDLNGRAIASQKIVDTQGILRVDLAGLSSGIYLLDLRLEDQPGAQAKLVVQ